MHRRNFRHAAFALALVSAALSGCGGGGGDGVVPAPQLTLSDALSSQATSLAPTAALQDALASNFLDAGMTRAQVLESLTQDGQTASATPEFSGVPLAKLSDTRISNCDRQNVCTLTGTLTNDDADTTSVPFTARVVLEDRSFRLLGDQQPG